MTKIEIMENKYLLAHIRKYISIILFIVIVILGFLLYTKSNEIKSLSVQVKSDEFYEFKNELVGKWIEISYRGDTSMYQFNQDNSWEYTALDQSQKFIRKGEYQIGKEMGVFLRRYGSQHWFHDTTYRDIKSGIGTSYLFVRDSLLINNQEDYQHKFIKLK
jgi:hypothetical protein